MRNQYKKTWIISVVVLSGCSGVNYILENYSGVPLQQHIILPKDGKRFVEQPNGVTVDRAARFRIFDKPSENRLMITPSIGDAAAIGAVRGATFGIASGDAPEAVYRFAAQDYLNSTNRVCTVNDVSLLVTPQYEVQYSCDPLEKVEN